MNQFHVAGMCIGGPYMMGRIEHWKAPEHQPAAQQAMERFLAEHTPR